MRNRAVGLLLGLFLDRRVCVRELYCLTTGRVSNSKYSEEVTILIQQVIQLRLPEAASLAELHTTRKL